MQAESLCAAEGQLEDPKVRGRTARGEEDFGRKVHQDPGEWRRFVGRRCIQGRWKRSTTCLLHRWRSRIFTSRDIDNAVRHCVNALLVGGASKAGGKGRQHACSTGGGVAFEPVATSTTPCVIASTLRCSGELSIWWPAAEVVGPRLPGGVGYWAWWLALFGAQTTRRSWLELCVCSALSTARPLSLKSRGCAILCS